MKTTKEIVDEMMNVLAGTENFLRMLRNVASFYYRRRIKLSDAELNKAISEQVGVLLNSTRENVIMFEFVSDPEIFGRYQEYRAKIVSEAQARIEPKAEAVVEPTA